MKNSITFELGEQMVAYKAMRLLDELMDYFEDGQDLVNPETGEVIQYSELARVNGILHGIGTQDRWDIN